MITYETDEIQSDILTNVTDDDDIAIANNFKKKKKKWYRMLSVVFVKQ